jgi:hypothetical protein
MPSTRLIFPNLLLLSTCVLCFEVIATRVSSVIFVNDYAFMILSLSILGLSCGGIYSYYRIQVRGERHLFDLFSNNLQLIGGSLLLFILAVTRFPFIVIPVFYFCLLFLPFFFAGIYYALVFRNYALHSFKIYAADLTGAALGAIGAIVAITFAGPLASIAVLSILIFSSALLFSVNGTKKKKTITANIFFVGIAVLGVLAGAGNLFGTIPIGYFPEKDFHHVYPDIAVRSEIIDSRWSIYGRSDLVEHSHQDRVRHLFIDGAAGSQMFRFDGNVDEPDPVLNNLLQRFTNFIPFIFLEEHEKNSMLVIGPGGGKEVLTGLIGGVGEITGVEINPDFVDLVREHSGFNGGIYTDFPNVTILVQEGRQYVKRRDRQYDLIVMSLPSTQQVQNIEQYALSENYLLTVEAILDYYALLTPQGRMIFTVYNEWELKRLIVTVLYALERMGIDNISALDHFKVIEDEFTPTLVVKRNPYSEYDVANRRDVMGRLPDYLAPISYLPHRWNDLSQSTVNRLLSNIRSGQAPLPRIIAGQEFDISPSYDDSPYFYKIEKGVPRNFLLLFAAVLAFSIVAAAIPLTVAGRRPKRRKRTGQPGILSPLMYFVCIGIGFMVVEVTLFQKLVLYLGSPTVSLSILLSSLLVGMGIGSVLGGRIYSDDHRKRLSRTSALIVPAGIFVILVYPLILNELLVYSQTARAAATFFMMLPFGFLLGIPFPSCIRILRERNMEPFIPLMYGVNGAMSVLGSVVAVLLSMLAGFTPAFLIGLCFYGIIPIVAYRESKIEADKT